MNRWTYVVSPIVALVSVLVSEAIAPRTSPSVEFARDMAAQKLLRVLHVCAKYHLPTCQGAKPITS
jgi:hypothetical protein